MTGHERKNSGVKQGPILKRPQSEAAVTVWVHKGSSFSCAEAISAASGQINLADIGIENLRPREAASGGLLLEVVEPEGAQRAAAIAGRMSEVLQGSGVRVTVPTKKAELRVTGFDNAATPREVAATLAGSVIASRRK